MPAAALRPGRGVTRTGLPARCRHGIAHSRYSYATPVAPAVRRAVLLPHRARLQGKRVWEIRNRVVQKSDTDPMGCAFPSMALPVRRRERRLPDSPERDATCERYY